MGWLETYPAPPRMNIHCVEGVKCYPTSILSHSSLAVWKKQKDLKYLLNTTVLCKLRLAFRMWAPEHPLRQPEPLHALWEQSEPTPAVCTPNYGGWKRIMSPPGDKHRIWLGEVICLGLIKKRNFPKGSGSQKVACDWLPDTVGSRKYNHLGSDLTTRHVAIT